ncbi:MAG TPA: MMPL family transporter [Candidatus Saccharimonadia bacterium]
MQYWSKVIIRFPVLVLAAGIALTIVAAHLGLSVFGRLSSGGYGDPKASSQQARQQLNNIFHDQRADLLVLFTADQGGIVSDADHLERVKTAVQTIRDTAGVHEVTSYFSTGMPSFVSTDGKQTFATVVLDGNESQQTKTYHDIAGAVTSQRGIAVAYGGMVPINDQISDQIAKDLGTAEKLSFPILAVLLLLVFRSVVAALVPLALGGLSILVAFLLVRVLTNFTDVSVYAINIITLMGLGLAIDYSLFIVSRFREELAGGAPVQAALTTSLRTAGRTVFFSALTVILCLLGLLVFPQGFLRSMGLGGAAAVAATALLALTVLPAGLRLLGRHVNALALPGLRASLTRPAEHGFWYRYSHYIMRRPLLTLAVALEVLVVMALPFMAARFSTPDAKTVPPAYSSRYVNDQMEQNFGSAGSTHLNVIIKADGPANQPSNLAKLNRYLGNVRQLDGVGGTQISGVKDDYYYVQVAEAYAAQSRSAQRAVRDVRGVALPGDWSAHYGGDTAELVDLEDGLVAKLPWAGLLILLTTSLLFFIMLGSVVIPIKAVVLNILSLSAAFGLMVWIFQDGNLANYFGLVHNGSIDTTQPVLIFAIAFGLAMDYELFLLSRIKEEYDRTGNNTNAVAVGVQRTASIITSAALMLVVVIGLFATGKIGIIQQVGVGLAAAVAIDATIVRLMLVPSAMRLLGNFNWWAPRPLVRLSRKLNISES